MVSVSVGDEPPSPEFSEVIDGARTVLTDLYQVPDTHEIMFLQGGASLQFAMIPFNFGSGGAYVDTGMVIASDSRVAPTG